MGHGRLGRGQDRLKVVDLIELDAASNRGIDAMRDLIQNVNLGLGATSLRKVYVIDAARDERMHEIDMPGQPFQVTTTRGFAYVRLLDSERVAMINQDRNCWDCHRFLQHQLAGVRLTS